MDANVAAAKGIEPCPMCGSDQVRWRRRRPTDFVFTWLRWFVEILASLFSSGGRRSQTVADTYLRGDSPNARAEMQTEMREANTGLKTPRRFWRCKACRRKGHLF